MVFLEFILPVATKVQKKQLNSRFKISPYFSTWHHMNPIPIYITDLPPCINVEFIFSLGPKPVQVRQQVFQRMPDAEENIMLFGMAVTRCATQ
jgi:hypothetical protein